MTNTANTMLFTAGLGVAMVMCVLEVKAGTKTIGDFVLINAMMLQLYQPLYFVGLAYREVKQAATDIEAMRSVLAAEPEIEDRADARPLKAGSGVIRFDNVVFGYEPGRAILKGVSFDVPSGKSLAVVGPSGSGKSTIARLLFRLYDATSGRIQIDGQDVGEVTQASLRAAIGIVPQDTVLFNDTLRDNIRYGRMVGDRCGGRRRRPACAARRARSRGSRRLRNRGRRAGLETVGRRKAARRHRAHDFEESAHPGARRSDVGARHAGRRRKSRTRWSGCRATAPR